MGQGYTIYVSNNDKRWKFLLNIKRYNSLSHSNNKLKKKKTRDHSQSAACLQEVGAELHTQSGQQHNFKVEPTAEGMKQTLGYILLGTL